MTAHFLLLATLLLAFGYWYHAKKLKHIAQDYVSGYCRQIGVQILDDYVASTGIRLKRHSDGHWRIERTYQFEFASIGDKRYNGRVVLLGEQVAAIYMEPHQISTDQFGRLS